MGETKTACKQFVTDFVACTDLLRMQISPNICNQILGTQQRTHLNQLQKFIKEVHQQFLKPLHNFILYVIL